MKNTDGEILYFEVTPRILEYKRDSKACHWCIVPQTAAKRESKCEVDTSKINWEKETLNMIKFQYSNDVEQENFSRDGDRVWHLLYSKSGSQPIVQTNWKHYNEIFLSVKEKFFPAEYS